jgi:hypothetical protein
MQLLLTFGSAGFHDVNISSFLYVRSKENAAEASGAVDEEY